MCVQRLVGQYRAVLLSQQRKNYLSAGNILSHPADNDSSLKPKREIIQYVNYIHIVSDAIDFIETHFEQNINPETLAHHFHFSKFHFSRIFRAVTHQSIKTYIDERRMAAAADYLRQSQLRIVEIAFQTGFNSAEVFSRRFREFYGLSPFEYRHSNISLKLPSKLVVVERDFRNVNKNIVPRFTIAEWPDLEIFHRSCIFNSETQSDLEKVNQRVIQFVERFITPLSISPLYAVTDSEGGGVNSVQYRYGYSALSAKRQPTLKTYTIPASHYIGFRYRQDFDLIFSTVFEDICRLLIVENLQINKNGLDFFQVYDKDYLDNGYLICVPVI